jgi:hypothetical protein
MLTVSFALANSQQPKADSFFAPVPPQQQNSAAKTERKISDGRPSAVAAGSRA